MIRRLLNNTKIRKKLTVLNLFIVLLLIIVSLGVFSYVIKVYDNMLYESYFKYLEQSTNEIDNELRGLEAYTYNLLSDKEIQANMFNIKNSTNSFEESQEAGKLLKKIIIYTGSEKNITSIYFFDTTGYTYLDGINPTSIDEKNRINVVKKANDANGIFVLYEETADYGYIIGARQMRRTIDLSFENLGVVAFRLEIDDIIRNYLKNGEFKGSDLIITSSTNKVLYDSTGVMAKTVLNKIGSSLRGYLLLTFNDEKFYITYSSSEYSSWRYINIISYNEVFNRKEYLKNVILIVFIGGLIMVGFLSVIVASNITKPIQTLTNRMKRVENGDFTMDDSHSDFYERQDEIGQLHRDFEIMISHIDTLIYENYQKQIIIKDTNLKALQAQITPHFLYNTLESINWLAKRHGEDDISIMAVSLGKLMRNAVDTKTTTITLGQEIELLESYISIQKYRFEERLVFTNNISDCYRTLNIPKLTLQPIVENAIKHGVEDMIRPCNIILTAKEAGDTLIIKISDTGPGMSALKLEQINYHQKCSSETGLGIGIMNIDQRLKMIFGSKFGLTISSVQGHGTTVSVSIPLVRSLKNV